MPKLLQINIASNWGSTGKIMEQIGLCAQAHEWESYVTYGRKEYHNPSKNQESLEEKISEWFRINGDNREEVRQACYKEIDEQWNPKFQIKVIMEMLNL